MKPCFFSSGDPDEQTFPVSWLVTLPTWTRWCVQAWVHPMAPPRSWLSQPRGPAGTYCHSFAIPVLELPPHGNPAVAAKHASFAQKCGVAWRQPETGPWLTTWKAEGGPLLLTWSKKSHRSLLARQEELQTDPCWVLLLPQLSKKHWWVKSRAKQQGLQQLPVPSCYFFEEGQCWRTPGAQLMRTGQGMTKPNGPRCVFCLFKFHL